MKSPLQTPFLNLNPFQRCYGIENVAKSEDKWGKLHGPPRQWCTGEYHHTEVRK